MPATCLVTGAAGFIGSHLARALVERGERVVGLDNLDAFYDRSLKQANLDALASSRFEFVEADILDAERLSRIASQARARVIFHIAALAGVRPSIKDPARYARVNVDGLVNVLEAARAAGCAQIVFASSSSVYGNNSKVPFAEDDPVNEPISPYAATKRAGELICHASSHLFGLAIACLRFFTVYGPAQRPDLAIASFMRYLAAGEEIPMYGDGSTSRDYTFIDDIIAGVLAAADRLEQADPGFFRIWNLGGAKPVSLRGLIDAIGQVTGRTPRVRELPLQPGDVQRTFADLTRSGAELGFAPTTDFREGLARQWQWFQDHA